MLQTSAGARIQKVAKGSPAADGGTARGRCHHRHRRPGRRRRGPADRRDPLLRARRRGHADRQTRQRQIRNRQLTLDKPRAEPTVLTDGAGLLGRRRSRWQEWLPRPQASSHCCHLDNRSQTQPRSLSQVASTSKGAASPSSRGRWPRRGLGSSSMSSSRCFLTSAFGLRSLRSRSANSGPSSSAICDAGRGRHLLDLADEAAGLAGDVGQPVGPEDEQRDQRQHGELRQPDVKHWSSLPQLVAPSCAFGVSCDSAPSAQRPAGDSPSWMPARPRPLRGQGIGDGDQLCAAARAVGRLEHDRAALVAALAQGQVERDLAEDGHVVPES